MLVSPLLSLEAMSEILTQSPACRQAGAKTQSLYMMSDSLRLGVILISYFEIASTHNGLYPYQ